MFSRLEGDAHSSSGCDPPTKKEAPANGRPAPRTSCLQQDHIRLLTALEADSRSWPAPRTVLQPAAASSPATASIANIFFIYRLLRFGAGAWARAVATPNAGHWLRFRAISGAEKKLGPDALPGGGRLARPGPCSG